MQKRGGVLQLDSHSEPPPPLLATANGIDGNENVGERKKRQQQGIDDAYLLLLLLLLKQTGRTLHEPFHRQSFLLLFGIGRHLTACFVGIVFFRKDIHLTGRLGTGRRHGLTEIHFFVFGNHTTVVRGGVAIIARFATTKDRRRRAHETRKPATFLPFVRLTGGIIKTRIGDRSRFTDLTLRWCQLGCGSGYIAGSIQIGRVDLVIATGFGPKDTGGSLA